MALLFTSRWATPSAARAFGGFYRSTVPRRYPEARPADTQQSTDPAQIDDWDTRTGKVTVRVVGNLVVAIESFDEESADRVRAAVLAADK